ncbi:MAG TPA: GAF domain-containing protein, partial [Xenococcaceae cyanobacterium]
MFANSSSHEILNQTTDINLKNVDLTNCDREPIHIPNLIQPHGVLLAVAAVEYTILQVSLNTAKLLKIRPQELLNQPLSELLGSVQVETIRQCLAQDFDKINPLAITIERNHQVLSFDGIVHQNGTIIILELEPTQPTQEISFFNFYKSVKNPITKIQNTATLTELCEAIVQEIRKITGFDRVMVYRFDAAGAGTVIAEAATAELEPFLGLRYPATDIPKQAKYLYTLNFLRLIPDATYEPVAITPELNPLTKQPLDMSMAVLRSVSPLHTEYLKNMGVTASMSISLRKNQQLWGLIACHHSKPKKLPYEIRTICEFIGQIASFELAAKEATEDLDYKMKLKSIQSQFVEYIAQAQELETGLTQNPTHLLELVGASGVALTSGDEITLIGNTPDAEAVEAMLSWLESQFSEEVNYPPPIDSRYALTIWWGLSVALELIGQTNNSEPLGWLTL